MNGESYLHTLRRKIGNDLVLSASVAAVIRDDAGRLLLQEKSSGEGWSLPAGGIELGETPQQAVAREVLEETGYEVSVDEILGVFGGRAFRYTYPSGDKVEYVITLFRCRIVGGNGVPRDSETRSTRYFTQADMPALALPYPMTALFDSTAR